MKTLAKAFFRLWKLSLIFLFVSVQAAANANESPIFDEQFTDFLNDQVNTGMEQHKVAGATIAVVYKGELVYSNGFGFADIDQNQMVDAQDTLFRWGSVSKTFTWVALMQLAEQNRIDLSANINDYLIDVKVPDTFDKPITVRDLMAHMTGFEDLILGHIFEKDAEQVLTLSEYLNTHQPERVRPPGQLFTYSNYGSALAGQIVANVSNMSFEDYVEKHIFVPLKMMHSTFREPLPPGFDEVMKTDLAARVSKSFSPTQSGFKQVDHFTFISGIGPAGAMSAPVTDMARFAISLLNQCSGILEPQTCSRMRQPLAAMTSANHVTVNHGFFQHRDIAGHLRYGHNGGTDYFHSEMGIYPELDFAILVSTNTTTGRQFNKALERDIVEYVFGENKDLNRDLIAKSETSLESLERFTGNYIDTRRPVSNAEVLVTFTQPTTYVSIGENNDLLITTGEETFNAEPVTSHLYVDRNQGRYFEFVEDNTGQVTHLKSLGSFDRVSTFQTPETRMTILLVCAASMFVFLLLGLIRLMRRFTSFEVSEQRYCRRNLLVSLVAWTFFLVLLVVSVIHDLGEFAYPYDFPSTWLKTACAVGLVATVLTLLPIRSVYKVWRNPSIGATYKVCCFIPIPFMLLLIMQLYSLHLLGVYFF